MIFDFCDIDLDDGIAIISYTIAPDPEMSRATLEFLADENIYHYRVFDFKDFPWHFSHQDVIDISTYSKSLFKEKSFTCFAAQNDLAFGTIRELSFYREQEGFTEVSVFRTVEESIEWMRQKKAQEEAMS